MLGLVRPQCQKVQWLKGNHHHHHTVTDTPQHAFSHCSIRRDTVHVIGELLGATHFDGNVLCSFEMACDETAWDLVEGDPNGQTHVATAQVRVSHRHTDGMRPVSPLHEYEQKDGFIPFSHPLDLHYSTSTIEGWPQISVQVWTQDKHGRNEIGTITPRRLVCTGQHTHTH